MRTHRLAVVGSIILVIGVAAGAIGARVFAPREARADDRPTTSTIYVGSQGLVFRTHDGHAIARLSSDSGGGVLELLDAAEQPRSRIRASGLEVVAPSPPRPPARLPPSIAPSPRVDLGF